MADHKNYLFVHFRETTSPEGEQVYFGLSRDGFHWEALNGGRPILWAYYGDRGVRDMTIFRDPKTQMFHIFATDLSLSYGMRGKYDHSWDNITAHGSKCLAHWQSEDLLHWSEEELIQVADERFGCVWAPDLIYDRKQMSMCCTGLLRLRESPIWKFTVPQQRTSSNFPNRNFCMGKRMGPLSILQCMRRMGSITCL